MTFKLFMPVIALTFVRRHPWPVYACLLCLLAWLCFGSLRTHLLDSHDAETFRDHLQIQQNWTFLFSADKEQAPGRPLADVAKYLAFLAFGNDPAAFHLLSVALHTLASGLLAGVVFCYGGSLRLALVTGLLFLLNVTHFEAVHHISALDYPLALSCGLAALLALSGDSPRFNRFVCWLVLGTMAHMAILTVWGVGLYLCGRCNWGRALRQFGPSILGLGLLVVVLVTLTSTESTTWHSLGEYDSHSVVELLPGIIRVMGWFCSRLLTTAHWLPLPVYLQQTWEFYLGIAICTMLLWLLWRRQEPLATAALAVLLGLLPFLLLTEATVLSLHAGPSRYLYFASAGSSLLLAWGVCWVGRRTHAYASAALLIFILISSYHALKQVEAVSLYTSARNYTLRLDFSTAIVLHRRALDQGAEGMLRVDIYSRLCLLELFLPNQGVASLEKAREEFPDHPTIELLWLVAQVMRGEESAYAKLISRSYDEASTELIGKAFYNIARGFSHVGNQRQAIVAYQRSLEFLPDRQMVLEHLAKALSQEGRQQEATAIFLYIIQLVPADANALYNAALSFHFQGQRMRAAELCRRALAIAEHTDARYLLTTIAGTY